jgi:hypothetical protein
MKKCIKLFISILFFGFRIYGQVNEADTIQFLIFDKNPDRITEGDHQEPIRPIRFIDLKVKELNPLSYNDSLVIYIDNLNDIEVSISEKAFRPDMHTFDFEKNLIDGKVAFGHDGFSSKDYVTINFRSELGGIKITDHKTKKAIDIVNSDFPVCLHPYLTNYSGQCAVKLFRVQKYFNYVIVLSGGGGGAGSYENYIIVDIYNRGWIFAKDITTGTTVFVPMLHQKDPFMKGNKRNWYKINIIP